MKFRKAYGNDTSLELLARLIKDQSEFFNLVENISDKQAVDIADLLFGEYANVTIEDIVICFRYAKTGKPGYEKPMSRLDGRVIFNWINEYLNEKIERIELIRSNEAHELKQELGDFNEENLKKIEEMFCKPNPVEPAKPPMSAEKQEQYIRDNIGSFNKAQISDLIRQFKLHHSCLAYEPLLNFLETELKLRK